MGCEIELIVVDDGSTPVVELSTDWTTSACVCYASLTDRCRPRNAGIEVARGGYFRFVDSDGVILPDSTSRLPAIAHGKDRVIAYGATLACDEELRPLADRVDSAGERRGELPPQSLRHDDPLIALPTFRRRKDRSVGAVARGLSLRAFERAPVRGDRRIATHYRLHPDMSSRNPEEAIRGYRSVVDR
ncbi:MAG: glycosyltransferase family 2 protein [Actinomycetota bacterium]|nr:glycosyltransferase family 2 protein [Actinomycetota bacterium]